MCTWLLYVIRHYPEWCTILVLCTGDRKGKCQLCRQVVVPNCVRLDVSLAFAGVLASASVGRAPPQSKAPTTDSVADLVKVLILSMLADFYPNLP